MKSEIKCLKSRTARISIFKWPKVVIAWTWIVKEQQFLNACRLKLYVACVTFSYKLVELGHQLFDYSFIGYIIKQSVYITYA